MTKNKLTVTACVLLMLLFAGTEILGKASSLLIKGTIKGKVINSETGEPVVGATVMLEHTSIGAITNNEGEYIITNAPVGKQDITASMIGFGITKTNVEVFKDEVSESDFKLEESAFELGAITVTGTATPHVFEDNPVKTEVISRKTIEQKQAVNLAEALSFQTGVIVENDCNNCNFTQVRINGLDGKYSSVLIDGLPMMSTLAGVYGLEQMPEEMIQQIEIVKGGGSALYGGNAVAGIINLVTGRPMQNKTSIKYLGNFLGDSPDNHLAGIAELVSDEGNSGAYIFGSMRNRKAYDYNGDGYSELGSIKNESIGLNWFMKPIASGELKIGLHHIHEERRGGSITSLPVHEAEIAEWVEHWRTGGAFSWTHNISEVFDYRAFYSFALVSRDSYYGGLAGDSDEERLEALNFYGKSDNPLHLAGARVNANFGSQLVTAGIEYSSENLDDRTAYNNIYHINETYNNFGFFLQDNLHFLEDERLEFVVGARLDKHSELDDPIISPRVNAKFELFDGLNLRASFSTGFKAPQIFDEDLHIGALEGDQRVVVNSDGLKKESSRSVSGGIDYLGKLGNFPFLFALTGFSTSIDDAFMLEYISKEGNTELWERVNGSGARVSGIEFSLGIQPIRNLELRGGMIYKKSEYDEKHEDFDTKNFFRTPDVSGNLRISYNPSHHLNLFTLVKYLGSADVPHEVPDPEGGDDPIMILEESDSYFVIDAGVMVDVHIMGDVEWKISFGVKNLLDAYQDDLDVGADRDPGYLYGPSQPRTLYVGFKTEF